MGLLRHDVERGELNLDTLRALVAVLTLRDKPRAAAAVADLVAVLAAAELGGKADRPARPGRSLLALRQPELDERSFPPGLPPGIRQIMRLVGPHLRPSGGELAQHLARHGVSRSERAGRGEAPRPVFDSVGAELAAGDFELYVRQAAAAAPVPLRVEPGSPAAVIVGAPLVAHGAGGDSLRGGADLAPCGTNLDAILSVPPEEAAAVLVGIIRQFVPDYLHPGVRDALVEPEAARAARLIPRKIKPAVVGRSRSRARGRLTWPLFTLRCATAPTRPVCWRRPTCRPRCAVVLAASGMRDPTLSLSPIVAHAEALALLRFAVSDAYDDLAAA